MAETDEAKIKHLNKPLELNYPSELDKLMSNEENAVVLFYKPFCEHCANFKYTFKDLADNIHRTNLRSGSVPIVLAQMDGEKHRSEIEQLRPGFLTNPVPVRGYPTILFKRGDGVGYIYDPELPRDTFTVTRAMSQFFGDPSLYALNVDDLNKTMKNPNPDFVYLYSNTVDVVPRFVKPLNASFTNREDGVKSLSAFFFTTQKLLKEVPPFQSI